MAPEENYERATADRQKLVDALGTYPRMGACSVGILILREDGWAELKPSYERGEVTTRQFRIRGRHAQAQRGSFRGLHPRGGARSPIQAV